MTSYQYNWWPIIDDIRAEVFYDQGSMPLNQAGQTTSTEIDWNHIRHVCSLRRFWEIGQQNLSQRGWIDESVLLACIAKNERDLEHERWLTEKVLLSILYTSLKEAKLTWKTLRPAFSITLQPCCLGLPVVENEVRASNKPLRVAGSWVVTLMIEVESLGRFNDECRG